MDASSDSGIGVSGTGSTGVQGIGGPGNAASGIPGGPGITGTGGSSHGGSGGVGVHGIGGSGGGVVGTAGLAGLFDGDVVVNDDVALHGLTAGSSHFLGDVTVEGNFSAGNIIGCLAGTFNGAVQVNGNFSATDIKSFVQAHPSDLSREIVYVALEGGEAGTYVRGSGQLVNGKAVLALPEHFGLVTAEGTLTISLAPRGEWLQLYVVELDPTQVVVREAQGKSGVFDYLIHGVRKGYEQHEVIRTKR